MHGKGMEAVVKLVVEVQNIAIDRVTILVHSMVGTLALGLRLGQLPAIHSHVVRFYQKFVALNYLTYKNGRYERMNTNITIFYHSTIDATTESTTITTTAPTTTAKPGTFIIAQFTDVLFNKISAYLMIYKFHSSSIISSKIFF